MIRYIVSEGEAQEWSRAAELARDAETYGWEWVMVDAADEAGALAQAALYDARRHPAQREMDLYAAAHRAHIFGEMLTSPAQRLRTLRQRAALTQAELAAAVGVEQQHVARWEAGTRQPSPTTRRKLATALGVTPAELAP